MESVFARLRATGKRKARVCKRGLLLGCGMSRGANEASCLIVVSNLRHTV